MARKFRIPDSMLVSEREYGANLAGMNTFFGAVLGFVIADVKLPGNLQFAQFLIVTAAIVIGILYISASRHRFFNAALTLLLIYVLPRIVSDSITVPARLQITLAVWTVMTILLEAFPRRRDEAIAETKAG